MIVQSYSAKLMLAGIVVCVGGIAIAVVKQGAGQNPVLVGSVIALAGLAMAVHGWLRRTR